MLFRIRTMADTLPDLASYELRRYKRAGLYTPCSIGSRNSSQQEPPA